MWNFYGRVLLVRAWKLQQKCLTKELYNNKKTILNNKSNINY